MRIIYSPEIFTTERRGGISRYFSELATYISKVEQVSIFTGINNSFVSRELASNNDITLRGIHIDYPSAAGRAVRIINDLAFRAANLDRSAIVHYTMYPIFRPKLGTKSTYTIHDMIWERFPNSSSFSRVNSNLKRKAANSASLIIVPTNATAELVEEIYKIPGSNIRVIPHGITAPAYDPRRHPESSPYFVYVGKRNSYKGFDTLLSAFSIIAEKHNDVRLICVGGGGFSENEIRLSKGKIDSGKISQTSATDEELFHLYNHAAATVITSHEEGFGFVGLEAMASRCPVIGTDIPCFREVYGEHYRSFQPGDAEELYALMEDAIERGREAGRVEKAYSHSLAFNWYNSANSHISAYKEI